MRDLTEKHILTKVGMLNCQVCSTGTIEEGLDWVRIYHEAGTQNNWCMDDRECVKPVVCKEDKNRMHFVFTC